MTVMITNHLKGGFMSELKGKTIAILVGPMYNEWEFWYPFYRLKEAGATVVVVGEAADTQYKSKIEMVATSDKAFAEVRAAELDGIIIPGGFAPDFMRRSKDCLTLVKEVFEQDKLIAFICHAGWVPISAGIVKGKRATSFFAIKDDMVNAGCLWEDGPMIRDGNLISSRTPDDLPAFMKGRP
jgi:protease I